MRRTDRLFQIVLTTGRERIVTGKRLAAMLGVTTRTVYRDIRSLIDSDVPIQGEAGVGYRLRRGYQIPPLMFTDEELQALHLGASIVRAWSDAGLAKAAGQVLAKVDAVLPAAVRPKLAYGAMIVPGGHVPTVIADHLSVLRGAIGARRKVTFNYPDPSPSAATGSLGRWSWHTGAAVGPWAPGARTWRTSGPFVSMEFPHWRSPAKPMTTSRAGNWWIILRQRQSMTPCWAGPSTRLSPASDCGRQQS